LLCILAEVVEIHEEGEYQKDTWAMSVEEKLEEVPALKEKGNALFKEKKYCEAADTYGQAIGLLDQLLLR
jgi:AH receptor-interacting protein